MQNFLTKLPTIYKAVAAFIALLIPFLTSVGTAFSDGEVTTEEWIAVSVALAALLGGTRAVWQVPNKKK